jgi:ATP-dependent Zn protease
MGNSGVSEEKELAIDKAVQGLCDEAYETSMQTLQANRELLDELTALLIEKETIDGFELNDLILKMTGKPPPTAFGAQQGSAHVPLAVPKDDVLVTSQN